MVPTSQDYVEKCMLLIFRKGTYASRQNGRVLIVTHKGDFRETIEEIWNHKHLSLFANFHTEGEVERALTSADFREVEVYAKEAYYDFPKERVIAKATK